MGFKSNYSQDTMLKWMFTNATVTRPTAWYVALFTTLPAEDGTGGVEVSTSGTGYARQPATFNTTTSDSGTAKQTSNTSSITFGPFTASVNNIIGFGIYDASTGGNLLACNTFSSGTVSVSSGNTLPIAVGDLKVSLD